MKRSRILWIVIAIMCLLLVVYCVAAHNSLNFALKKAGYCTEPIRYIVELEKDSTGYLFSVFQIYSDDDKIALIYAKKDALGFWHLSDINDYNDERGFASLAWLESAGVRRYSFEENPVFEKEWHFVYCGNNAVKDVVLRPDQLPDNCTANIQQAGEFYLIHIICFATKMESIEIDNILSDNGCIVKM